jgi:hypothetical protein
MIGSKADEFGKNSNTPPNNPQSKMKMNQLYRLRRHTVERKALTWFALPASVKNGLI